MILFGRHNLLLYLCFICGACTASVRFGGVPLILIRRKAFALLWQKITCPNLRFCNRSFESLTLFFVTPDTSGKPLCCQRVDRKQGRKTFLENQKTQDKSDYPCMNKCFHDEVIFCALYSYLDNVLFARPVLRRISGLSSNAVKLATSASLSRPLT